MGESTDAKPRQNTAARTVNITAVVFRMPVNFYRIICALMWRILCHWYGIRIFPPSTTQVTDIVGSTPLWRSIRNFFFRHSVFSIYFFVVCSTFHKWYMGGGQYQFFLDFDHWLYMYSVTFWTGATKSKSDVAIVWFMQWARMALKHGRKDRYWFI